MELFTISKTKIRDIEANYNNQNANINNSNNLEATRGAINDYIHRKIAIDYYHERLNENGVDSDKFFTLMKNGWFKLNDFSTSYIKPHNCSNLDVRDILRNGFETVNLVKSNPPRHLDSTLNVLFEAFMGISSHQSGGVGAVCLNWFLAP
jgi:anaerobic ribonucleoside-triphosphate reductase